MVLFSRGRCCGDVAFASVFFVCRPSAGLQKTQLFNEHIDQHFSHLHFPHRERERDGEEGEKKRKGEKKKTHEETKALEKL